MNHRNESWNGILDSIAANQGNRSDGFDKACRPSQPKKKLGERLKEVREVMDCMVELSGIEPLASSLRKR
jgi:hypothetical protein